MFHGMFVFNYKRVLRFQERSEASESDVETHRKFFKELKVAAILATLAGVVETGIEEQSCRKVLVDFQVECIFPFHLCS